MPPLKTYVFAWINGSETVTIQAYNADGAYMKLAEIVKDITEFTFMKSYQTLDPAEGIVFRNGK